MKVKVGDIIKIELNDCYSSFARVLEDPLVAFYDGKVKKDEDISLEKVISRPVLFKIWVMRSAFKSKNWNILGNMDLEDYLKEEPKFFKKDLISKNLFIYYNEVETPATKIDCRGLERAGVWDQSHIEDRLRDYYKGVPNKWLESHKKLLEDS